MFDPQSPVFQAAIAPFVLSLILVGALFLLAGERYKRALAVCGAGAAVLVAYWLAFSWPAFPPRAASQKLAYLIALSTFLSLVLGSRALPGRIAAALPYIAVLLGLAWIAEPRINQGDFAGIALIAVIAMAGLYALGRRDDEPVDAGVAVLVFAFALAGIAFFAPSVSIAQLAGAIAAATGGYLLWTWPKRRLDFSVVGIMALATPLIWLAAQASLYSRASDAALGIAAAIALAPPLRAAIVRRQTLTTDTLRPIWTGMIAAAIGGAALAVASFNQTGASGYG
ncbi:MAG: hypothetical protein AAGL24_27860 [Pseudomonadota bacterium]